MLGDQEEPPLGTPGDSNCPKGQEAVGQPTEVV